MADTDAALLEQQTVAPPPADPPPSEQAKPAPTGLGPRRTGMADPDLFNLPLQEFDSPETTDLELAPAQFQSDAIENNYWWLHERRTKARETQILEAMSEQLYGSPMAYATLGAKKPDDAPGSVNLGAQREANIASMFAEADRLREVDPGRAANLPTSRREMMFRVYQETSRDLTEEHAAAGVTIANRSDPNFSGGVASFAGSMAAGVSDVEGVATLPFGAGAGTLARTVLIESLLGGAGAALQVPAQQKQAARLGTDAPDPVNQILSGFAFGGILPIAGRTLRVAGNTLTTAGRARNADLIRWGNRPDATAAERGAAAKLASDEAARETAPPGRDPDSHAAALDRAAQGLQDDAPDMVRADDVVPEVDQGRALPPIPDDAPENWKAIRGGIFAGESGGDYEALFGYSNRAGGPFSKVKVTEMTVDQALEFSNPSGTYGQWVKARIGRVATPMGAYQIVGTTLRAAKEGLGLRGDELLDEALQERLGVWIYNQQGTGAWEGYRGPRANFTPRTTAANWRDPGADALADDVRTFNPNDIQTDATGYQFKMGGDQFGVTGRLTGERVWDANAAVGVMIHERLDGTRFIADGHQRLGLANRLIAGGAEDITLQGFLYREADGWTVEDIRARAALKNIRQESGTPLDAAKILRDNPELANQMGSRSRPFMLQAQGLADLAPGPFQAVVNEVVPQNYAAMVGRLIPEDDRLQGVAIAALKKTDPANETQAESVVRDIRRLGLEKKADEDQMSLFGDGFDLKQTVISERMKITDAVIKAARTDRAIFTKLEKEADTIQEAGNVLDRTANLSRADAAERILGRFLILANQDGPIRAALDDAARTLRAGGKLDAAVEEITTILGRTDRPNGAGLGPDGIGGSGLAPADLRSDPDKPNLPDTRGKGVRFHGSTSPIVELSGDFHEGSDKNFYGQGFYTSDAVAITDGYASAKRATNGRVYRIREIAKVTALDMEQVVPDWFIKDLESNLKGSATGDLVEEALGENPATLHAFYDNVRELSPQYGFPTYEVQEIFETFSDVIKTHGFNALDQVGGLRTKKTPHAVRIYLEPKSTVRIDEIDPSNPIEGLSMQMPKPTVVLEPVPNLTKPNLLDLPAEGDARLEPGLFDDPVTDRAEIFRLDAMERDNRAALQDPEFLPDMDMEVDLFGDGPTRLPLREATARLAEETDFVDALKTICMKGA